MIEFGAADDCGAIRSALTAPGVTLYLCHSPRTGRWALMAPEETGQPAWRPIARVALHPATQPKTRDELATALRALAVAWDNLPAEVSPTLGR